MTAKQYTQLNDTRKLLGVLNVIILNGIMPNVIIMSVSLAGAVAPFYLSFFFCKTILNIQ
jgi:hypothetical protein